MPWLYSGPSHMNWVNVVVIVVLLCWIAAAYWILWKARK